MYEEKNETNEMEELNEDKGWGNGWDYNAGMSVNASDAMDEGRFPYSRWEKMKKVEILERIMKVVDEECDPDAVHFSIALLKKAQKQVLLDLFVESSGEWHHVPTWIKGRRYKYNQEYFYTVFPKSVLEMTDEKLEAEISKIRKANAEKYAEVKEIRKANRDEELQIRKNKPLAVGYFTKEATYRGKGLNWDMHYIGVVDGSRLYYYGFYEYDKTVATRDRSNNLDILDIHWTSWPYNCERFDTFADFVKQYPQFKNKEPEINRLMQIRAEDRAKKGI